MTNALPLPWQTIPEIGEPTHRGAVQENFERLSQVLGDRSVTATFATFTPTWSSTGTQPAIGNGILTGRWSRIGNLVHFTINLTAGNSTTFGTGNYTFSLPVPSAAGLWALSADVVDTGTQHYTGIALTAAAGGSTLNEILVGSNTTGPTNWGATNPFTFGDTDRTVISGIYEAA